MGLAERLVQDMKDAMRSKDTLRLNTVRLMRATLQAEATSKRKRQLDEFIQKRAAAEGKTNPDQWPTLGDIDPAELPAEEPLTEEEMLKVLGREVKKRHDSVDMYHKGGRDDLADQETAEIAVLNGYLPQKLTADEVRPLIQAIISEVGATGKSDLKKVMPVAMARLREQADGRVINQVVAELLGS